MLHLFFDRLKYIYIYTCIVDLLINQLDSVLKFSPTSLKKKKMDQEAIQRALIGELFLIYALVDPFVL